MSPQELQSLLRRMDTASRPQRGVIHIEEAESLGDFDYPPKVCKEWRYEQLDLELLYPEDQEERQVRLSLTSVLKDWEKGVWLPEAIMVGKKEN
jgi:hypothetical protein